MTGPSSADRVLAILDLFTEARPVWTPDQMLAPLGYSRPTLYRYLKALRSAGLLASQPGGRLSLGPRIVEMDFLLRKSDPLIRHGRPHLHALVATFPCSALLVRWYGEKLLCVASECSVANPVSSYPRGRPMPLARGAISRAIMAFLPRPRLVALVEAQKDDLRQIGLGRSAPEILDALRDVRRAGVAVAFGEVTPGVVGIAAPVFDGGRAPLASVSVTISGQDMTPARLTAIQEHVRDAASDLSDRLGRIDGAAPEPAKETMTATGG